MGALVVGDTYQVVHLHKSRQAGMPPDRRIECALKHELATGTRLREAQFNRCLLQLGAHRDWWRHDEESRSVTPDSPLCNLHLSAAGYRQRPSARQPALAGAECHHWI